MRLLRRLLSAAVIVIPMALIPSNAAANSTVISMVSCVRAGHIAQAPAGSQITLRLAWAMSTRGNLQDFVNASTATFTLDGAPVTPVTSDLMPLIGPDQDDGSDGWRVAWTLDTTAPPIGQTLHWTTSVALSRAVTDHEGGLGKPSILPAGVLLSAPPFFCDITGV